MRTFRTNQGASSGPCHFASILWFTPKFVRSDELGSQLEKCARALAGLLLSCGFSHGAREASHWGAVHGILQSEALFSSSPIAQPR